VLDFGIGLPIQRYVVRTKRAFRRAEAAGFHSGRASARPDQVIGAVDDGRGFDPAQIDRGAGLRCSIIGRLEDEGGRVTVDSVPGRGTRLVLELGLGLRLSRAAEAS
jgi:glucose-6-phosphate-specific signal transduction histidine kinase